MENAKMSKLIAQQTKSVIASIGKIKYTNINNSTPFMDSRVLSFDDCVSILYELQHKFLVVLPESNYVKYATVGGVINDIQKKYKPNNSRREIRYYDCYSR